MAESIHLRDTDFYSLIAGYRLVEFYDKFGCKSAKLLAFNERFDSWRGVSSLQ